MASPIVIISFVSVVMRWNDWNESYPNIEATHHSLLTLSGLLGGGFNDHFGLPTVSLPGEVNHWISWGATVPTASGAFIYTSFPPLGWIAPAGLLSVFNQAPSVATLFGFGAFLGLCSSLLLGWTAWLLIGGIHKSNGIVLPATIGTVVGLTYVFSPEVLLSQGVQYWPHALAQVFWIIAVGCLVLVLRRPTAVGPLVGWSLAVLLFCLTEWSGYVAGLGTAGILLIIAAARRDLRFLVGSALSIAAVGLAALITTVHFAIGVGLQPLLQAWTSRFLARSAQPDSSDVLINVLHSGLGLSFGFVLVALIALLLMASTRPRPFSTVGESSLFILVIGISAVPLLENYLMLQHAGQFTFDRLKWMIPLTLAMTFAAAHFPGRRAVLPLGAAFVAAIMGFIGYSGMLTSSTAKWAPAAASNVTARNWVVETIADDYTCATFTSSSTVRAYLNNLFSRGILEHVSDLTAAKSLTSQRDGCATVFLETSSVWPDMHQINRVTIVESDGAELKWDKPDSGDQKLGQ